MFSFMIIGSVGLQQGIAAKYREMDRLKTYIPPEDPEKILQEMQANLLQKGGKDFKQVVVPGKRGTADLTKLSRAELRIELLALRESEVWTGMPLVSQKRSVKKQLKLWWR